jgi:hypothetical protein
VEVLSFLIDCIAQRRMDGENGNSSGMNGGMGPDDEYAMFGLAMVHRAILAGGPALQLHEALLGLLHRELFAAMTVAVSCNCWGSRTYQSNDVIEPSGVNPARPGASAVGSDGSSGELWMLTVQSCVCTLA